MLRSSNAHRGRLQRIYIYKLTVDAGAAPCIRQNVLSLAICKPTIRRVASEGDLIFGFTANSLDNRNRLIFAATITKKLAKGEYFRKRKYLSREDCIYRYQSGRLVRRKNAKYHERPQDLVHDLGHQPDYVRSNVLLSSDFRYYGAAGTDEYKSHFPLIRRAVENLGRGHRVNLSRSLADEFLQLKLHLWCLSARRVLGQPTNKPTREACYRGGTWKELC
ncbi:hypothetical protein JQ631_32130 [Bradyrhizobium manausense]|uniref:Nmad2 family putative nucleotide modification protein n=1 Tax=Bradyrhizobium manausense TaxID=989370 RepID=UPI001BAB2818|nr:hypothetical protein [Bradyrhizobium manausense]